jgi:hypothetical protein
MARMKTFNMGDVSMDWTLWYGTTEQSQFVHPEQRSGNQVTLK